MTTARPRTTGRKATPLRAARCMAALLFASALSGCGLHDYLPPQKLPYAKIAIPYHAAELGKSTTLDVLNLARDPAYQFDPAHVEQALLTQSDTVVAYSGRSTDARKTWLNMIVFDEFRMTARRKYFFCIDEKAENAPDGSRQWLIPARRGIVFDSEFAVDPEILTTPYATAEAQKIAIVRWLADRFARDLAALVGDLRDPTRGGETLTTSGMMVRQMFTGLLVELDKSPGLAARIETPEGIPFPHISLGEGRIQMLPGTGAARMTIRVNLPMPAPAQ